MVSCRPSRRKSMTNDRKTQAHRREEDGSTSAKGGIQNSDVRHGHLAGRFHLRAKIAAPAFPKSRRNASDGCRHPMRANR